MKRLSVFFILLITLVSYSLADNVRYFDPRLLTCNLLVKVCQDSRGNMWVATEYGLNKYDGVRFTQYVHKEHDNTSLAGNVIKSLMVDRNRCLWVCTSCGLQYYNPETDGFELIKFSGVDKPAVVYITQMRSGELWAVVADHGIYKIDKQNRSASLLKKIVKLSCSEKIGRVYEDNHRNVWVSTDDKGLVCINASGKVIGKTQFNWLPNSKVTNFLEDNQDNLFITVEGRLFIRHGGKGSFVLFNTPKGYDIRCIEKRRNGSILVGTYSNGILSVDVKNKTLVPINNIYIPSFDLNKARVVTMTEDRNGNMWLGCFRNGLLLLSNKPTPFKFWNFFMTDYQDRGEISAVYCDRNDRTWMALENKGLYQIDDAGNVLRHIPLNKIITSIYQDSNGKFWIGTYYDGLATIDINTGACSFYKEFAGERVKTILEDRHKNIFISIFGKALKVISLADMKARDVCQHSRNTLQYFRDKFVNTTVMDRNDCIWIGHYLGVSCYDSRHDRFIKVPDNQTLQESICYSLLVDHAGNVWIGTNNGIFVYNPQRRQFTLRYSTENGISDNVICGLVEDNNHHIWCSTFNGINEIDVKCGKVVNFYAGNGLVDKEYTRGVYTYKSNGNILFVGDMGITSFSPNELRNDNFAKEVMLSNMFIGNSPVTMNTLSGGDHVISEVLMDAKEFTISHSDNSFTFEFSTMDFRDPDNIYYEYRLNYDKSWSSTHPGISQITFNHLAPGTYTLEVRACENGLHTHIKQFIIHITPPWYQTRWAYFFYALFILLLLYQIYNIFRRKQTATINEAKLQFFINVSHEIRSPMTLIISPLETLLKQNFDRSTMLALQSMHKNAKKIVNLINQLLDIRKLDKGQMRIMARETDLVIFVKDVVQDFNYQAGKSNIKLEVHSSEPSLTVWIDRNNFDKVISNVVSNALKFTPDGGEITVDISTGKDENTYGPLRSYAEIKVSDTGSGIDESKLKKIFERFYQIPDAASDTNFGSGVGLNVCSLLVKLHHGTIVASNRKDTQGACFTIRIPLGHEHFRADELGVKTPTVLRNMNVSDEKDEEIRKNRRRKTNYTVLLIDDDEDLLQFLQSELSPYYKVLTARNGEKGFEIALTQLPDIVVSDIVMPVMDGYGVAKKLKNNINTSYIPIILLTSKSEYTDRIEGLEMGVDGYLSKPFVVDELDAMILNLIENRLLLKGKFSGKQDQDENIKPIEVEANDEVLMKKIMRVINDNIDDPDLNVEKLAKEVGISRVQLHRKMKQLTGISTGDFIRNIRLKQAATLLRENKINISQVAYAVGFASHTHFSAAFKKFYGVTPSEFISKDEQTT